MTLLCHGYLVQLKTMFSRIFKLLILRFLEEMLGSFLTAQTISVFLKRTRLKSHSFHQNSKTNLFSDGLPFKNR